MGYPYYGRTDVEGRRFDDDRERWEEREHERGQREGTRFDENRWRGRERAQGYVQSPYERNFGQRGYGERGFGERSFGERSFGERGYGERSFGERSFGGGGYAERGIGERGYGREFHDDDREAFGYERHYPGQRGPRSSEWQRPQREHEDDRSMLERVGDRVREGLRRIGRGPKGFKRSDERIAEDVCERIARSHIDAEQVEVKVKDGEVTLTGFVEARYDKRNLEDIADDVFGVTEVHNQLRVQSGAQRAGTATASTSTTQTQSPPQLASEKGRVTHS